MVMPRVYTRIPAEERFWRHVNKDGPVPEAHTELGNCWLWIGAIDPQGYGHFWAGERTAAGNARAGYAHRFAYGDVPAGMDISHLCEVENCVRRSHLEAVPHQINVRYGNGFVAKKAAQTHCVRGHAFDSSNTYTRKNGTRMCLACDRLRKLGAT